MNTSTLSDFLSWLAWIFLFLAGAYLLSVSPLFSLEPSTMARSKIVKCMSVDSLFVHHTANAEPEPAFLVLDCRTGDISCESITDAEEMPVEVWGRLVLRWPIQIYTGRGANALMLDLRHTLKLITQGFMVNIDGHGIFSDQAENAMESVMYHLDNAGHSYELLEWFSAADWCSKFFVEFDGTEGETAIEIKLHLLQRYAEPHQFVDPVELRSHLIQLWSNSPDEALLIP